LEYYQLLKSRNIECKLVIYPEDCHAIDRPATEAEHWIEIALFLKKHFI
jgi:acylaminoacyl-peptidase